MAQLIGRGQIRAIDFFCGAGGLTRGLLDAGIEVVAGFDIDPRCRTTYERNNAPARFHTSDISRISPQEIWATLGSRRTSDLLFAGCAPCQPFSKHRKPASSKEKEATRRRDATLLGAFARLIKAMLPGQVLVENVPGLANVPGLSTYRRFVHELLSLGYGLADGVLDAKHFGVPQTRRRFILIAVRGRKVTLPERKCGPGRKAISTVADFISHYPPIEAGEWEPSVPNHVAAALSRTNLLRLRRTPSDGGDRRSWPEHLRLDCHKESHQGHTDVYGRMAWRAPAPTLTSRCNSLSNGRYGHPGQDRAISLREAASLQTFSDSYVFYGTNLHIARQIGNAVPVKFAEELGRHIVALRRSKR